MFEKIEDVEVKVHKEGRPWDETSQVFDKHDKAVQFKKELILQGTNGETKDDFDFKIKHLSDGFHVKFRVKQSVLDRHEKMLAEQAKVKKEKKQLNKKQRD